MAPTPCLLPGADQTAAHGEPLAVIPPVSSSSGQSDRGHIFGCPSGQPSLEDLRLGKRDVSGDKSR